MASNLLVGAGVVGLLFAANVPGATAFVPTCDLGDPFSYPYCVPKVTLLFQSPLFDVGLTNDPDDILLHVGTVRITFLSATITSIGAGFASPCDPYIVLVGCAVSSDSHVSYGSGLCLWLGGIFVDIDRDGTPEYDIPALLVKGGACA